MKHLVSIILIMSAVLQCVAQTTSFSATFSGMEKGTAIVVNEVDRGRLVPVDTLATDSHNRISFKRDISQPYFAILSTTVDNGPILHVMLLPGEKVSLDASLVEGINAFRITKVKGSDNMELYSRYTDIVADAFLSGNTAAIANGLAPLLAANPDKLMAAFMVTFYESTFDQYAPLYKQIRDALSPRYSSHDFVRHLDEKLRSAVFVGMEAPDIVLPDANGVDRRLSDLRGRVVLIDFWASWCRPCRMENPNVVRLYDRYHERGFEIFSVSLDNNRDAWQRAISADNLHWPNHVSDLRGWSSAGGKLYGIQSIPATVLVDAEGRILARNLRGNELEAKLRELFPD